MKVFNSIENLIGNTPLVRLNKIEKAFGLKCTLLAKLESFNPAGSSKDRVAKYLIDSAERDGLLTKGATIIEPTCNSDFSGLPLSLIAFMLHVLKQSPHFEQFSMSITYASGYDC
ncbi:MAG: pyridoxal-phosphate dependent enzyme, partial [Clostridia bacterium]|nr:pyridoxal-phosphate dependent enzyme [Clostridia bacterium]